MIHNIFKCSPEEVAKLLCEVQPLAVECGEIFKIYYKTNDPVLQQLKGFWYSDLNTL